MATKQNTATPAKSPTKSEILTHIANDTGISRKQVDTVLTSLQDLIAKSLNSRNAGQFSLPGLMKIKVFKKPATKARKGTNPFTGEETTFKAQPARKAIKIQPLKGLKDMV
jgi:nucleoid DNA-binding protein